MKPPRRARLHRTDFRRQARFPPRSPSSCHSATRFRSRTRSRASLVRATPGLRVKRNTRHTSGLANDMRSVGDPYLRLRFRLKSIKCRGFASAPIDREQPAQTQRRAVGIERFQNRVDAACRRVGDCRVEPSEGRCTKRRINERAVLPPAVRLADKLDRQNAQRLHIGAGIRAQCSGWSSPAPLESSVVCNALRPRQPMAPGVERLAPADRPLRRRRVVRADARPRADRRAPSRRRA